MPSEFNHIDDFFRSKNEEAAADLSKQDKHWQQMSELLSAPLQPTVSVRTLNKKLYWQAATAVVVIAAIVFLVVQKQNGEKINSQKGSLPPTVIKSNPIANKNAEQAVTPGNANPATVAPQMAWSLSPAPAHKPVTDTGKRTGNLALVESTETENTYESFFGQLAKPAQTFVIDNSRDTTLYCAEGSSLFIPAASFKPANGLSANHVTIHVKEFYELSDIISNKLTTTASTEAIVTGGMMHIEARLGNQPVQIDSGKSLILQMPTKKFDPEMQLFTGSSANDTSGVNWTPAGQRQYFFNDMMKRVQVLDLANDPRQIKKKGRRLIGKFILAEYSGLSVKEAKAELEKRYGGYYDEIRVRRGWKSKKIDVPGMPIRSGEWIDGTIGLRVHMSLTEASRFGLITTADSLKFEEDWRMNMESRDSISKQYFAIRDKYSFTITNLGWINCDRFYTNKTKKIDFIIDPGAEFKNTFMQSFLVFKGINSILPGAWADGRVVFSNVPSQLKASIICIGIKGGKTWCAIKELTTSETPSENLLFEETNPEDFRKRLAIFGNVKG